MSFLHRNNGRQRCLHCGVYFKSLSKHLAKSGCGGWMAAGPQQRRMGAQGTHSNQNGSGNGGYRQQANTNGTTMGEDLPQDLSSIPPIVEIPCQILARTTTHGLQPVQELETPTTQRRRRAAVVTRNSKRHRVNCRNISISSDRPRTMTRNRFPPQEQSQNEGEAIVETDDMSSLLSQCWEEILGEDEGLSTAVMVANHTQPVNNAPTTEDTNEDTTGLAVAIPPSIVVSQQDRAMTGLHFMCDQAGAPRYLGDKILDWLRKSTRQGFDATHPGITRRKALMARLHQAAGFPPPEEIPVTLESGKKIFIYRFQFLDSLQRHLVGEAYADTRNLVLSDGNQPWSQQPTTSSPNSPAMPRGEIHEGRWFHMTLEKEQRTAGEDSILHPLLLYIDKTGTDMTQSHALEPLMATSTILSCEARESAHNWFPLGLVPTTSLSSSAKQRLVGNRKGSRSLSVRDYHLCLSLLLEPFKKVQKERPRLLFRRGDQRRYYRIICPVAAICGDNLATDVLCARVKDYGSSSPRLVRRCLTDWKAADVPNHVCNKIDAGLLRCLSMGALTCTHGFRTLDEPGGQLLPVPAIEASPNLDWWVAHMDSLPTDSDRKRHKRLRQRRQRVCDVVLHKVLGSHAVDNAFHGVDFGSNPSGVFRATLTDIMHTLEEGIIPEVVEIILGPMSDKCLSDLDTLVAVTFDQAGHNRSSERSDFPRVSFKRGYSSLTLLSATERVGQLFTLALLFQLEEGREILASRFDLDFDQKITAKKKSRLGQAITNEEIEVAEEVVEEDGHPMSDCTEDEETPSAAGTKPTQEEVKTFLNALGLGYITTRLSPTLPKHHKTVLESLLQDTIRKSWLNDLRRKIEVPPHRWDYKNDGCLSASVPISPPVSSQGQERVNSTLDFEVAPERESLSMRLSMEELVYLLETLLTCHSYLKYGYRCGNFLQNRATYTQAMTLMRKVIVAGLDRGPNTNGWKLQKFVELAHLVDDIADYGWAGGYSTSTGERGLKQWAKQPAKTAQKRREKIFSQQVCMRIHEDQVLRAIVNDKGSCSSDLMEQDEESGADPAKLSTTYSWSLQDGLCRVLPSGRGLVTTMELAPPVQSWFQETFGTEDSVHQVPIFFEVQLGASPHTIVRAHPNYCKGGPWYDFVLLAYDVEGIGTPQEMPARCVCFFNHPNTGELTVLVQECLYQTRAQRNRKSQLCSHWSLGGRNVNAGIQGGDSIVEADLTAFPVEVINRRIYAVMTEPEEGHLWRAQGKKFHFIWVHDRKDVWPHNFLRSPEFCPM